MYIFLVRMYIFLVSRDRDMCIRCKADREIGDRVI